ncbi:ras-like protein [Anaeramoeba ignava]|uniref:Ras-like protein n=1 Tax=Anaeramoeba ignava TaxID=1746090 RepID=A0A9Q0RC60_ANAIG|nr:ras-like protein [Anaeramoeba ignava]
MRKGKENLPKSIKINITGSANSGRNSIARRFYYENFYESVAIMPSKGEKEIQINDLNISIETLVSPAGEDYSNLIPLYAIETNTIIFAYSITSSDSFKQIGWYFELMEKGNVRKDEKEEKNSFARFLVGNKIDLEDQRQVSFQEGEEFAKRYGMFFMEVSAKNNENVDELFEYATIEGLKSAGFLPELFPFIQTFQEEMVQFFERKEFTDYLLVSGIPLHSLILKYRMGENYQQKLEEIKNERKEDLILLMKFIYSGLSEFNVSKTQELCEKMGIESEKHIGREKLVGDMEKLYLDEESKDFSIIVKKKEIKVHKIILALRSEVYREMFKQVQDESGKVSDYTNSKIKTIQVLIRFFYTDLIDEEMITKEIIEELKEAKDFYQLNFKSSLPSELEYYLQKKILKEEKGKCLIF